MFVSHPDSLYHECQIVQPYHIVCKTQSNITSNEIGKNVNEYAMGFITSNEIGKNVNECVVGFIC